MAKTTVKEAIERLDRELRRVLAENSEKMAQYYRGETVEPECLGSMPELIEMNYMLEINVQDTGDLAVDNRFIDHMILENMLTDEEEEKYNFDEGYNFKSNAEILIPIIQKITENIAGTRLDTSDIAVEMIQEGLSYDVKVLADRERHSILDGSLCCHMM